MTQIFATVLQNALPALAPLEMAIQLSSKDFTVSTVLETSTEPDPVFPSTRLVSAIQALAFRWSAFLAGVHGLGHIGTEVMMTILQHVIVHACKDKIPPQQLQHIRLVSMPNANFGGSWAPRGSI